MGIREALNQKPGITAGIAAMITGAAVLYIIWQSIFGVNESSMPTSAYFTTDDGKTWFVDDISKAVPFIKDGQVAVRVHLYSTDGGQTKIPLYLEKLTDKGLKIHEAARANEKDISAMISANDRLQREWLVKRPGDEKWYPLPHYDVAAAYAKERFKDDPNASQAVEVSP